MLNEAIIDKLQANLRGRLIRPNDSDYDKARTVYNAMIDRYPSLIARCVDVAATSESSPPFWSCSRWTCSG